MLAVECRKDLVFDTPRSELLTRCNKDRVTLGDKLVDMKNDIENTFRELDRISGGRARMLPKRTLPGHS